MTHTTPTQKRLLNRIALAAVLLATPRIHAQTAAKASTESEPASETVVLSPFEVGGSSTSNTYLPSESATGSRVNTPIKDLPFSINIVTNEMMQDFGIFEIGTNINQFVPGLSDLDQGGSYNLRGFNASFQLRDGFFRLGRYSSSNIDRIEVINGPNAAIYGAASPGGLVNMISKAPRPDTSVSFTETLGSYQTDRSAYESTGTIAHNTYYILDLALYERAYANQFGHDRDHEFFYAIKHDFSKDTHLTVQYEFADRRQHSPPSAAPQIQNASVKGYAAAGTTAPAAYTGFDFKNAAIDQDGPYSMLDRSEGFLTGIFESRINSIWSTRTGLNYYAARRWDFGQNESGATEAISATGVATIARAAAPQQHDIFETGGSIQQDALASYSLMNGKVNAKSLFTFDYLDYYRSEPLWQIAGSALSTYWTPIKTITLGQPIQYYMGPGYNTEFPYTGGNGTETRHDKNRASDWGGMFRQQFYALDDRLKVFVGARDDYVIERDQSLLTPPSGPYNHRVEHFLSPNAGANYSITKSVMLFANYSEGFNPNSQSMTAATASGLIPGETDSGWDYGVKVVTPNGKFTSTADAYYYVRNNVAATTLDPTTGVAVTLPDGNQLVRGWELTESWSPTDSFTMLAFWGHINSKYTKFGEDYTAVGRSPKEITPDDFGVTTRYAFHGALEGLACGLNGNYMRATPYNAGNTGDTFNSQGVLISSTEQWAVTIPSYYLVNGFVSYKCKIPFLPKLQNMVQLNVNNLLNRNYIDSTAVQADSRGYYISDQIRF